MAAVVAIFSFVQAVIAFRKLRLDLFARRFEAWETVNEAISARQDEISQRDPSAPILGATEAQKQIWRYRRLMRALFPEDVDECLRDIEEKLIAFDIARMNLRAVADLLYFADRNELIDRRQEFESATANLFKAQDQLMEIVHPYIKQYGWIESTMLACRRSVLPRFRALSTYFGKWRSR